MIETKAMLFPDTAEGVCLEFEFAVGMVTDSMGHIWVRLDDFHWGTDIVIPGVTFITITAATVH